MSRKRQAEAAGTGLAGSRLAQKAYRDAYLSVELSTSKVRRAVGTCASAVV